MLLVTLLPLRVMPLLPLATLLPRLRQRRRLLSSPRSSNVYFLGPSVNVPLSTSDRRSQDTGRGLLRPVF